MAAATIDLAKLTMYRTSRCAVPLLVGVTVRLGIDALTEWPAWLISPGSLAILLRWKISPAWIVLGGGIVGLFLATIR